MAEIITTGKTVDEAVEEACRQLGVNRDEIMVEILEMPQKILFFSKPAKVRVTKAESDFSVYELLYGEGQHERKAPEKKEQPQKPKKEQKQKNKDQERNQNNKKAEEVKQQTQEQKQPKEQKQDKNQKKEQKKEAVNELKKVKKAAEKKEDKKAEEATERMAENTVLEMIPEDQLPERAVNSFNFLKEIVAAYGAKEVEYQFAKTERGVCIQIGGEDAPMLIGKRGELMDAIQYLCTVGSSREGGDYCRVSLDVEGYRSRRETALRSLAEKTSAKVKKNRRSMTLEPMNPYERAIVHSEVQKIEGVTSHSVGSEPRRKVVITLEGASSDEGRRSRRNRSGKAGKVAEETTSETTNKVKVNDIPVRKELKSTEEFIGSLYGKIEL